MRAVRALKILSSTSAAELLRERSFDIWDARAYGAHCVSYSVTCQVLHDRGSSVRPEAVYPVWNCVRQARRKASAAERCV